MNFVCELRLVIVSCENSIYGIVTISKIYLLDVPQKTS